MNRRDFLKQSVSASGAIAFAPALASSSSVSVTQHGADPTGKRDSTAALRAAIAALPKQGGHLIFANGSYRLDQAAGTVLTFNALRQLTVEGNGALLLCSGQGQPLLFASCTDTNISGLQLDWPVPPFSQGVVKAVAGNQVDITLDPEFVSVEIPKVEAIGQYDPSTKLPSPDGIDSYHTVTAVSRVSPQVVRLSLKQPLPFSPGMHLVLRHTAYGANALVLRSCTNTHLADVTIHASPGLGLLALGCSDLSLDNFAVTPTPGTSRYLSTNSDGSHFVDCRGSLSISNCRFRGMGDDAVNAFASYWTVQQSQPGSITVSGRSNGPVGDWQLPHAGDTLHVVDASSFRSLTQAQVTRAELSDKHGVIAISGAGASIPEGALVCNLAAAPQLQVSESHFLGNRARGVVAHANVNIANSDFSGCSMPAILLAPDAHWMEGPAVQKVVIRDNRFSNCAYAKSNARQGVITIDTTHDARPEQAGAPAVNKDIVISGNTFDPSPAPAIYCAHASGISLLKNTFAPRATRATAMPRMAAMRAAVPMQATSSTAGSDQVVIVDSDGLQVKDNTGAAGGAIVLSRVTGVNAASNVRLTVKRPPSM
jgi:hypothetical protein